MMRALNIAILVSIPINIVVIVYNVMMIAHLEGWFR